MRKIFLGFMFLTSFSSYAGQVSIKEQAKSLLEDYARVDSVDWYNKGDTAFAENDGFIGVYRHLKASVSDNSVNLKMDFVSGPKRPDSDEFSKITSDVCITVFSQLINPPTKDTKEVTWDDEPVESGNDAPDHFAFMRTSGLDKVHGQNMAGIIDGWQVSIKRTVLLTTCSAKKT